MQTDLRVEGPYYGHLVADSAGNLYGTTDYGGASNSGTVFMWNKTTEPVLDSFTGGNDGVTPVGKKSSEHYLNGAT